CVPYAALRVANADIAVWRSRRGNRRDWPRKVPTARSALHIPRAIDLSRLVKTCHLHGLSRSTQGPSCLLPTAPDAPLHPSVHRVVRGASESTAAASDPVIRASRGSLKRR